MPNISDRRSATNGVTTPQTELVMVTDRQGLIEFVNKGFEQASGYTAPEIIGRDPSFLKSGQHSDTIYRHLWNTILQGETYRGELVNRRKDGRLFRESKAIFPLRDRQGAIAGFVAIGSEIAERSELQDHAGVVLDIFNRWPGEDGQDNAHVRSTVPAEILSILENERKRIASELHDDIGQILTGAKMRLERAISMISNGDLPVGKQLLAEVVPIIREAMDEVRRISLDLRPPMIDDLGIVATIGWFCREFPSSRGGLHVELDLRVDERDVPEHLKIVIYRVLQEAMNNIVQHAAAGAARVRVLRSARNIELFVEDDGCGFDLAQARKPTPGRPGLGLTSMRERVESVGGSLSLETIKGAGTIVRARFPCDGKGEPQYGEP